MDFSRTQPDFGPVADEADVLDLEQTLTARHACPEAQIVTLSTHPFTITHVNTSWERLCGFREVEAVGKTCKILQGEMTCPKTIRHLNEVLRRRVKLTVRLLNYGKDRKPFVNVLTITPLFNGKEITHFLGTLRSHQSLDQLSTPMSSSQQCLKTHSEQERVADVQKWMPATLGEAVNFSRFAMVITERAAPFRIVHVNEAWCTLCGFTMQETLGLTCKILQGPDTCAATLQALKAAALSCTAITVKLLNYRKVCRMPFAALKSRPPIAHSCERGNARELLPVVSDRCRQAPHRAVALIPSANTPRASPALATARVLAPIPSLVTANFHANEASLSSLPGSTSLPQHGAHGPDRRATVTVVTIRRTARAVHLPQHDAHAGHPARPRHHGGAAAKRTTKVRR